MNRRPSPYVGPRPFAAADELPGRAAEVVALRQTLISARIVVLQAPSGAGKTSLLEASNGLRRALEARQFHVHRTARVGLPPPPGAAANRYAMSVVHELTGDPASPAAGDLSAALATLRGEGPRRRELLVLDQFEEVLTADPTDDAGRVAFFDQLAEVLMDPHLWALFVIRDDYLGALAPWARRLPTHLARSHRLGLLDPDAAREAIRAPAAARGVTVTDAALDRIVAELRQIVMQGVDGRLTTALGPWVEPVQLQVVCERLWSGLADDADEIGVAHVEALGGVDAALAGFFAAQVAAVAAATGVPERTLREFIGTRLISPHGIRTQVIRGGLELPLAAIAGLEAAHLIRGEERRGVQWFELAHDRLVAPVRADNAAWAMAHLHPMQLQAAMWAEHGEMREHLLAGEPLAMAEAWAAGPDARLTPREQRFLERSREHAAEETRAREAAGRLMVEQQARLVEQARRMRQLRRFTAALGLTLLATLALAVLAWRSPGVPSDACPAPAPR